MKQAEYNKKQTALGMIGLTCLSSAAERKVINAAQIQDVAAQHLMGVNPPYALQMQQSQLQAPPSSPSRLRLTYDSYPGVDEAPDAAFVASTSRGEYKISKKKREKDKKFEKVNSSVSSSSSRAAATPPVTTTASTIANASSSTSSSSSSSFAATSMITPSSTIATATTTPSLAISTTHPTMTILTTTVSSTTMSGPTTGATTTTPASSGAPITSGVVLPSSSSSASIMRVVLPAEYKNENKEQEPQSVFSELIDTPEIKEQNAKIRAHTITKFNAARKALNFEEAKTELDPVALFKKYKLPADMPSIAVNATDEQRFYAKLDSKNAVAIALGNKMYFRWYWIKFWTWFGSSWSEDKRNIKAGRLVCCQEMIELFDRAMKEGNFSTENKLDEIQNKIDAMHEKLNGYLEQQKQRIDIKWRGPEFNIEINKLQFNLQQKKDKAKIDYATLHEIQELIKKPYDPVESINDKNRMFMGLYARLKSAQPSRLKNNVTQELETYMHSRFRSEFQTIEDEIQAALLQSGNASDAEYARISEKINIINDMIKQIDLRRTGQGLQSIENEFNQKSNAANAKLDTLKVRISEAKGFQLEKERVVALSATVTSMIDEAKGLGYDYGEVLRLMQEYKSGAGAFTGLKDALKLKLMPMQKVSDDPVRNIVGAITRALSIIIPLPLIPNSESQVELSVDRLEAKSIDINNVKAMIWLATHYLTSTLQVTQDEYGDFLGIKQHMINQKVTHFEIIKDSDTAHNFIAGVYHKSKMGTLFGNPIIEVHDIYKVMALICIIIQAEKYLKQQGSAQASSVNSVHSLNTAIKGVINHLLDDKKNLYDFPDGYCVTLGAILKLSNLETSPGKDGPIEQLITRANKKVRSLIYNSPKSEASMNTLKAAALSAVAESSRINDLVSLSENRIRSRFKGAQF